jgi:hypothetical protein
MTTTLEQANEKSSSRLTDVGGIFYPVGYLVAAFPKRADAERVRKDLMTGGYDAADCELLTSAQVAQASERNLEQNTGFLATLGRSDEYVRKHLESAQEGASFLLIFAPGDTDADRAMNVIRRGPFEFVHRYRRLVIEKLK